MSDIVKRVWEVPVCRVGYGHRKLRVEAPGESRVVELALDVAGDFEFSENTSKYSYWRPISASSPSPPTSPSGPYESNVNPLPLDS